MNLQSIIHNHTHSTEASQPQLTADEVLAKEERDSLSRHHWLQHRLTKDLLNELEDRYIKLMNEACSNARYVGDVSQQTRLLVAAQSINEIIQLIEGEVTK